MANNKPNILALKDANGNPAFAMSHSSAIKMEGESKTLTQKIKEFEGFETVQVQGNTRCLHVSSDTGVQNNANAFVVWDKLDYSVVLKKITCSFDYQGVKRCVIVIADYTGDTPIVSATYNIQMEQDQTEMNLEEMNIVVPKNHVVAFGVERLLSNGSWVKTIRKTYATFKGLKFVPSSGGYGSYPVYSIGSRATNASASAGDLDSVFAIFDYEGVKSVKKETGYIENGSIGDDKKAATVLSSNAVLYYQCFEDSLPYDAHVDSILLNKENVDDCSLESLWVGVIFALNGSVVFSRMYLWSNGEYEIPIDAVIPRGAVLLIRCGSNASPFKFYGSLFTGCYVSGKYYPGATVSYSNSSRTLGARLKYHRVLDEEEAIKVLTNTKTSTTYADMTSVALFGSSLTWCGFSPKGLSWVERLNDIVDVNIANFGTSGSNFIANIRGIVNDNQYGDSLKALVAKWFCFNNTANGTGQESGETSPAAPKLYHSQMHQALEVTKAFGAKMIMGGEDSYTYDPLLLARNIKSFCKETDTPMSLTGVLYSLLYRKNKPYAGFHNGHGGYRTSSIMMIHEELFKHLYIKKSVKMFKIREGFVESISSASDLNYTTVWERNKKWRSLCCGVGRFYTTAQADNIDGVGTTDSQKTITDSTNENEVLAMKKGHAVTFYNYALCEFILDKVQITKGKFTIETPSSPSHIYVARNVNNSFASVFEETSFTYEDGVVTVVLEGRDIELYDKVKIVIANDSSSFVLSKPTFEDYDGVEKDYKELNYHPRYDGEELNPKTSCEEGWTMGGNASVKQLPASMANYPDRNSVKAHIQLETDGDSCTKTFDIQRCSKVAIRIDATLMPKIATKRFVGTSDADSEYVTTTDTVAPCEWLNGDLIVTINGYAFQTGILQPWWFEHYFEFDIEPDDESITIKIERHTEQNGSTRPVLIHNVSVQKIC